MSNLIPWSILKVGGLSGMRYKLAVVKFNFRAILRRRRVYKRRLAEWFYYQFRLPILWFFKFGLILVKSDSYNDGESWGRRRFVWCLPWVYRKIKRDSAVMQYKRLHPSYDVGIIDGDPFEVDYPDSWDFIQWDFDYPESIADLLDIAGASAGYYRGPGLPFLDDPMWSFKGWGVVLVLQRGGYDI